MSSNTQEPKSTGMLESGPYAGHTVIEHLAAKAIDLAASDPSYPKPPPTPPQPIETHTRSGEGFAQIQDDQDQEYLYE